MRAVAQPHIQPLSIYWSTACVLHSCVPLSCAVARPAAVPPCLAKLQSLNFEPEETSPCLSCFHQCILTQQEKLVNTSVSFYLKHVHIYILQVLFIFVSFPSGNICCILQRLLYRDMSFSGLCTDCWRRDTDVESS